MDHSKRLKNAGIAPVDCVFLAVTIALFDVCGLSSDAVADEMENDLNWTGFYLGLGGGYSNNEFKIRDRTSPRLFSSFNTDTDVGIVGLYAGYNYQIENVVLGLEADSYVGFGGKTKLSSLPVPSSWKSKVGVDWSVRGRLGYVLGQRFMPYISGGYAGMMTKRSFGTGYVGQHSYSLHGWTIGGGAEYMITPHWLVRLDYQYEDYGSRTIFPTVVTPAGIKTKVNANQITFGTAYKF